MVTLIRVLPKLLVPLLLLYYTIQFQMVTRGVSAPSLLPSHIISYIPHQVKVIGRAGTGFNCFSSALPGLLTTGKVQTSIDGVREAHHDQ